MSVDVADEVRELLPAGELRMLLDAFIFECVVCGKHDSAQDSPASVVVRRDGLLIAAGLAHTRCSPSAVREVEPGTLQVRPESEMTAQAIVLPGLDGDRPAIACEFPGLRAVAQDSGADLVTPYLRALGLHALDRIAATPPVPSGWAVRLPDAATVGITAPDTTVFYSGPLLQPAGWHDVVRHDLSAVVLLVGSGLELQADRERGALLRALQQAARSGGLVGGTLPVTG